MHASGYSTNRSVKPLCERSDLPQYGANALYWGDIYGDCHRVVILRAQLVFSLRCRLWTEPYKNAHANLVVVFPRVFI